LPQQTTQATLQPMPVFDCNLPGGSSLITTQSGCDQRRGLRQQAPPQFARVTPAVVTPPIPPQPVRPQALPSQTPRVAPPVAPPETPSDWRKNASMPNHILTVDLRGTELYKLVAPSVYFVGASNGNSNTISLGSAVAISGSILITNCHVVAESKYIILRKDQKFGTATVVGGEKTSDRCFLRTSDMPLTAVQGVRSFQSLEVGEDVYAVGNPRGFESTFSPGIISGKRAYFEAGLNYIQTTAPITNGSSGGALFDRRGNLVGINTLVSKGEGSLGFAIAADEFWTHR
jgi:S1-C subfamily serine protease